mgnify:CR=1 FL=1
MAKKPNIHGGGFKTNLNGLSFEKRTNFITALEKHPEIIIKESIGLKKIYYSNSLQGYYTEKHDFYKYFLQKEGVIWKKVISKKYLPDAVFINKINKTIYIIEKKYQAGAGSVDEKLQTCDFKKKVYIKLINMCKTSYKVEYYYLLSDWYKKNEYDDVKKYIVSVNCKYFINIIDLGELGIQI